MAETLIFCAQGYANSISVSLGLANMFKGQGVDVAVLFSMEALVAFAERRFVFSPLVAKYAETVIENTEKMGMSTDPMETLKRAKGAGGRIYACGFWADLLGVRDKLPPDMEIVEIADMLKLFTEAKKVVTFAA